ncbi:emp24/gp25L/p24 family protein [Gregarina niphandrodes]|uniref:Emp24/gp25L/p24 family protein n=1 Tax=Gregarina niphandrodes TaxID=110365 RepID=A0A023BBX4_GRENI|nr:emp24/gp25L/p24 family protein [Gregarina niphandrodes]EZG81185.1 emp24/gp25L/p24 family protein [Gregarina niphandrodes]|eukprot:XP_011134243.1 emp24/gp25L/p24 family protein [Gregarina niphandrodes]
MGLYRLVATAALLVTAQQQDHSAGEAGLTVPPSSLPYFYVAEASKKCFYENTPVHLPVTVTYENFNNPGVTCTVQISDARGVEVMSRAVSPRKPSGKITYLTQQSGQLSVCVSCPSSKWFGTEMLKWSVSVDLGDTEVNLQDVAKGLSLENNEKLIRTLTDKLNYIRTQNEYQEQEEHGMHKLSQSLSRSIVGLAIVHLGLLGVATFLSVGNLNRYFRAEKLV